MYHIFELSLNEKKITAQTVFNMADKAFTHSALFNDFKPVNWYWFGSCSSGNI